MKALIVDDEPLARRRLRRMLQRLAVQVVGEAEDGLQALQMLEPTQADLLFLDIRMPGLDGLTLAQTPALPPIIFTTAYQEHAVEAFEVGAIDYLLKPITEQRLTEAVRRAAQQKLSMTPQALTSALRALKAESTQPALVRLTARHQQTLRVFDPAQVGRIFSQDKYAAFEHQDCTYYLDQSLNALEHTLAPLGFLRVHRAELINLAEVQAVHLEGKGAIVELRSGERAQVSRRYLPQLKQRLGVR